MKTTFLLLILGISSFAFGQNGQSYNNGNITASSSDCSVANSCVMLGLLNDDSAASITVTGTFSATLQFEVSANYSCTQAGVCSGTWFSKQCFPTSSSTGATSTTSTGTWSCGIAAMNQLRVRGSAYASGTAAIELRHSKASASLNQGGGGGSGTVTVKSSGSLTDTAFVTGNGTTVVQTPSATSTLDSSGNAVFAGSVGAGTAPTACGSATGCLAWTEAGTSTTPASGQGACRLDSTTHRPKCTWNNVSEVDAAPPVNTTSTASQFFTAFNAATGAFTKAAIAAADLPGPTTTKTISTPVSMTVTGGGAFYMNQHATAGTAITYNLPTAAANLQVCVKNSYNGSAANTGVLTVATSASGQFLIDVDGTLGSTGGNIASGGAGGDGACFEGVDSTHWQVYVQKGTWTKS